MLPCGLVPGRSFLGLEDQHGTRGCHRHRVDRRDDRRNGNRHRELAKELAADAAQEAAGNEYRAEHQRDGEYRAGDFLHRLDRGGARIQAGGDQPLDVLQHDNGIIHDNADGQHQAKERQVVQRKTHRSHDGERANQRHRHVNHRQDHRLPVLQKHQHDDGDQDDRVAKRIKHLVDRFADERRRVVNDLVVEAVRKAGLQFLHLGIHATGGVESVGAWKLKNGQRDRRLAIERAGLVVLLRASFDTGNIAQSDDASGLSCWTSLGARAALSIQISGAARCCSCCRLRGLSGSALLWCPNRL